MARFGIYIRKETKAKDGKAQLRLSISHGGQRKWVKLPTRVKVSHWNAKSQSVRSAGDDGTVNQYLQNVLAKAHEIEGELIRKESLITAGILKELIQLSITQRKAGEDFISYARRHIDGYRARGQVSTFKRMRATINKLEAHAPGILFEEISPAFLRSYRDYLMQELGNNLNTASKNLGGIRTIFIAAIRDGIFPQEKNPFFQVTLKTKKVVKKHLHPDDIERIVQHRPTGGQERAKDYFLFSFYMFGMRFSDVAMLKPEHIVKSGKHHRCVWTMGKVDREHGVLVVPPAMAIMKKYKGGEYVFPIMDGYDISSPVRLRSVIESRNARVNQDLKKIQNACGIETHISFHIARHSITGYLISKGWDVYDISKALGHSSIKQTETYLRGFDFGDLDDKMESLWD